MCVCPAGFISLQSFTSHTQTDRQMQPMKTAWLLESIIVHYQSPPTGRMLYTMTVVYSFIMIPPLGQAALSDDTRLTSDCLSRTSNLYRAAYLRRWSFCFEIIAACDMATALTAELYNYNIYIYIYIYIPSLHQQTGNARVVDPAVRPNHTVLVSFSAKQCRLLCNVYRRWWSIHVTPTCTYVTSSWHDLQSLEVVELSATSRGSRGQVDK